MDMKNMRSVSNVTAVAVFYGSFIFVEIQWAFEQVADYCTIIERWEENECLSLLENMKGQKINVNKS